VNLDHLAHFVPDPNACRSALLQLGFSPAPFSLQYHRLSPGEPLLPAGTGNHCVMLEEGYLEFLAPLAETGVAAQLRSAIGRYVGAHSIVFGTSDAENDYRRLRGSGFAPLPPIQLQRPIGTAQAEETARFTVVRVAPGVMPEGRIQFCQHHTEDLVWQERWLSHPNGAVALRAVFVCVEDLDAAAERYARFTGSRLETRPGSRILSLQRGRVELYDAPAFGAAFGIEAPPLPWIAGCELACRDLGQTRAVLCNGVFTLHEIAARRILVRGPAAVGGIFIFSDA